MNTTHQKGKKKEWLVQSTALPEPSLTYSWHSPRRLALPRGDGGWISSIDDHFNHHMCIRGFRLLAKYLRSLSELWTFLLSNIITIYLFLLQERQSSKALCVHYPLFWVRTWPKSPSCSIMNQIVNVIYQQQFCVPTFSFNGILTRSET